MERDFELAEPVLIDEIHSDPGRTKNGQAKRVPAGAPSCMSWPPGLGALDPTPSQLPPPLPKARAAALRRARQEGLRQGVELLGVRSRWDVRIPRAKRELFCVGAADGSEQPTEGGAS